MMFCSLENNYMDRNIEFDAPPIARQSNKRKWPANEIVDRGVILTRRQVVSFLFTSE